MCTITFSEFYLSLNYVPIGSEFITDYYRDDDCYISMYTYVFYTGHTEKMDVQQTSSWNKFDNFSKLSSAEIYSDFNFILKRRLH